MAAGVSGEMVSEQNIIYLCILKYNKLKQWEQEEIQKLKELISNREDNIKIEIDILIGDKYKNLSNLSKKYDFFISYEFDSEAYKIGREDSKLLKQQNINNDYKNFPWRMGMDYDGINILKFELIENISSNTKIKNYIVSSKVHNYSINKTKINYINTRCGLFWRIISRSDYGIPNNQDEIYTQKRKYNSIYFYIRFFKSIIKIIFYALFIEKKWNIFIYDNYKNYDLLKKQIINLDDCYIPKIASNYNFYGDPFFGINEIYVEALNKKTKLGEIIAINIKNGSINYKFDLGSNHFSYPQFIFYDNKKYLLPEVADHSRPIIYEIGMNNKIIQVIKLGGLESVRLLDATYFYWKGSHYLFGGLKGFENQCLNLYYSKDFFGEYHSHPSNPIVMSPEFSRMAGSVLVINEKIYRFSQNNKNKYGEKINLMEIVDLSNEKYMEIKINEIVIKQSNGPHTLNFTKNYMVGDFYNEKFSILAGFNRLVARMKS